MEEFSHYSDDAKSSMVDVSEKKITLRIAKARGVIKMQSATLDKIEKKLLPKGDPFEVGRISGIMAAKKCSELVPMCHPLLLEYVDVSICINKEIDGVEINSEVRMTGKTGAEMEALTSVTVAALTIYDMCKAVDKTMVIEDVKVIEKQGGKSDFKI